tara:strand:- start:22165 stop:22524 length:360 start_codon:yes stop_codon:yes gene_type:complete
MEVQGKIKVIGEVKVFGAKGFRKAELILDVTEKPEYPQFVNLEFTQDNTDLLSKFKIGDSVKVSINIGGREWINPEGVAKYFNSIQGWRIDKATDAPADYVAPQQAQPVEMEVEQDLPF